jgi:predicted RNA-binding protein YlqC (UPF0109 family)
MKKKLKKEEKSVSSIAMSEVTGTEFVPSKVEEVSKLSTLELSFGNEDMNKLVGKLNEVINKLNGN